MFKLGASVEQERETYRICISKCENGTKGHMRDQVKYIYTILKCENGV